MTGFAVSLGLEPLVQLAADGIRSLAIKTGTALAGRQENRINDKLIKAINIIMTESLPGETVMHSPTSYGWPELLIPHIQHVARNRSESVEFCQTVAERNIQFFYNGRLDLTESRKIVETIVRYHSDPKRELAFSKVSSAQFEDRPMLGGDFMTREYEAGWMLIDYELASDLESTTVVHTPQRAKHGMVLTFSDPIQAVAVRSTLEGVLVLICADENRLIELCGCAKCSKANDKVPLDWGRLFGHLATLGFLKSMHVLSMFLELQAREETTLFQWSGLEHELKSAEKLVDLEGIRLRSNKAYLNTPRAQGRCDITLSHSQFKALVGTSDDEKNRVKEELQLKYIDWDLYSSQQDEIVFMRAEHWGSTVREALAVLDDALESIASLKPRDTKFAYKPLKADLLPEMRFANMLKQYNEEGELVLYRGLESSLSKKHVTVMLGTDAGCLYRFGMDAAITYFKGGDLSLASIESKQTFTNFIPIHPIRKQAAVIFYISDQLTSREKAKMTTWVKENALNILSIVDEFADVISQCIQRRERNSISAVRQAVRQWGASDIEKAGLEREVLDVMLRMGFRDDGQMTGLSCYYDAINEIETFPRQSGKKLTLDQSIWLDGLGVGQTRDGEWALISDRMKKAVRIDRKDIRLNLLPETLSSTGFTVLTPVRGDRTDIHLIKHNPLEITETDLIRNDMRQIGGKVCRTGTICKLCAGR